MAGLSGILLIAALVLVSGLIAYVGDIVGRRMGRKRLSLFGLRPRHTAIVISVASGMLITIVTLLSAMAVNENVRYGFFKVSEMRRQQSALTQELKTLNGSMADLQRTREAAESELQQRKKELEDAKAMLEEVSADLDTTQDELTNASEALSRAEGAVRRVSTRWLELAREKDELQRDIENLRARAAGGIALERSTPIILGAGQPLDWRLIDGGQSIRAIRRELNAFVADLDAHARRAGAVPVPDGNNAIVIRKPVREPDAEAVAWFNDDQVLNAIAEKVHESAGGVIVRAFSVFNTHPGEPVRVDFELFRNHLVFRRGEVLAEASIDGRQSEPALMAALLGLLRQEVNARARAHNIMPRPDPSAPDAFGTAQETVGDISIDELFAVVAKLRSIGGPASVSAVAAADTWTIGPLEVDLLVVSTAPHSQR